MIIQIVKVEHKEYAEVITNEKYMNLYHRHGPDHWMHELGVYGWHRYMEPVLLEDAYQKYIRKQKKHGAQAAKSNL